jgi:hypothetical protein
VVRNTPRYSLGVVLLEIIMSSKLTNNDFNWWISAPDSRELMNTSDIIARNAALRMKPMQKNNRRLAFNFINARKYSTRDRGVEVHVDDAGNITVYARLYRTYIAKWDATNCKLYVSHGGWPTMTTTKAINACLPSLWRYSRRQLIAPDNTTIDVGPTWVLVEKPISKYMVF